MPQLEACVRVDAGEVRSGQVRCNIIIDSENEEEEEDRIETILLSLVILLLSLY